MRRLLAPLALALVSVSAASGTEIRALGGTFNEDVTAIRVEGGRLVVRTAQRTIPLETIKVIRFQDVTPPRAEPRSMKVLLTTGDWLRGTVEAGDEEALTVRSRGLDETIVPIDLVRALVHNATPQRERELEGTLADVRHDRVLLRDGGTAEGTVEQIDGTHVTIEADGIGDLRLELARVELIAITPLGAPPPVPPGLRVAVTLVDGTRLAGSLESLAGSDLRLVHALGGAQPLTIPVARVAALAVLNGAFVYLSDLEPAAIDQHFPPDFLFQVEVWSYKRDCNVLGGELRLGGRTYDKGLGVHSYCALTYDVAGGNYRELRAVIGLDDSTRYLGEPGFGAVVFKVLLDGAPCREYPSGIVQRKGQAPTEIVVNVQGAQSVTLVADFDPMSLHVLGRANWGDVHLVR